MAFPFPEPQWPAGRLAFPLVESRRPLRSRRRSLRGQAWALEGLRSLKIELLPNDEPLKFQSLGTDPLLDIRLIDERRIELLAWGVALLVLSIGLTLLRRPVATRAKYVAVVAIGATVLPLLLGGYRPWGATLDFALYAALLLIPVYLLAAVWRRLVPVVKAPLGRRR